MFQLGDDLCFTFEPQTELWVGVEQFARQNFDGNFAFKARIIPR